VELVEFNFCTDFNEHCQFLMNSADFLEIRGGRIRRNSVKSARFVNPGLKSVDPDPASDPVPRMCGEQEKWIAEREKRTGMGMFI
jgi:hypothetical protein